MKKLLLLVVLLFASTLLFAQTPAPQPAPPRARELPEAEAPTPPPPPAFGAEQEKEALEFIQMIAPFRMDNLKKLKQFDPGEYQRRLMEAYHNKLQLDLLKQNDPQQYQSRIDEIKMDQQSNQMGEDYRKATSQEEKDRIRGNLKTLLNQLFDVREKNKEAEIKHLEDQLTRLKTTMADRRKNKDQIVQNRLEELLDEGKSLRW